MMGDIIELAKKRETKQDKANTKQRKKVDKVLIKDIQQTELSRWDKKIKNLRSIPDGEWDQAVENDQELTDDA